MLLVGDDGVAQVLTMWPPAHRHAHPGERPGWGVGKGNKAKRGIALPHKLVYLA